MSFAKDISSSNDITQITTAFDQLNLIDFQNPEDIYWLGYCYEHGIEVEKDEDKAFIHYQKSANMNNSNGIYQVGYCYHLGIGVETNRQEAFLHYQKSAEAGNSMGIFKTAICYFYGIGVEKDEAKFYEWIEKELV
ncbi:calmodulin-dependent protein kinase [Gigaspora margarita]|uniref:Calmodulin-dependent protein kinase n=1 Tax=Gigaspora margarita TaxID=4874 RepID=A0A8H4AC30_GIGMA|nr:calmodulin-dependent protein kinase [Gigaspora margarita]